MLGAGARARAPASQRAAPGSGCTPRPRAATTGPGCPAWPAHPSQAGSAGAATVVLTGTQGYWYTPDGAAQRAGHRTARRGPRSAPPRCPACPAGRPGRPGGQLAASGPGDLALACPATAASAGTGQADDHLCLAGRRRRTGTSRAGLTIAGTATSLAAAAGGVMALGHQSPHRGFRSDDGADLAASPVRAGGRVQLRGPDQPVPGRRGARGCQPPGGVVHLSTGARPGPRSAIKSG